MFLELMRSKINVQYVQMCCGGHLGFGGIQRYANPDFVVINEIQFCMVLQISFL